MGYTLTHFWVGFINYPTLDDWPDKFRYRFRISDRNPWLREIFKVDADPLPNKEKTEPRRGCSLSLITSERHLPQVTGLFNPVFTGSVAITAHAFLGLKNFGSLRHGSSVGYSFALEVGE